MLIERKIKSLIIRVVCSQAYAQAASNVLDTFEKLAQSGTTPKAGTEIRFGWTLLRLIDDEDGLLITEPDFVNWPLANWSRTIDTSLEVLTAQVRLLHCLDVDGEDVFFDQIIICARGTLAYSKIFLRRVNRVSTEDSGWLLGKVGDPEALMRDSELECIVIASLVQRRPALLQVLTLPPGFLVVFAGDSIEQIFDAGGRQCVF